MVERKRGERSGVPAAEIRTATSERAGSGKARGRYCTNWRRRAFVFACLTAVLSIFIASVQPKRRPLPLEFPEHEEEATAPLWRVGVSKLDITPDMPLWLSGFASRTREPSIEEVSASAASLFVRSLSIRDASGSGAPLVLVSLDLIGADGAFSDSIFRQLEDELGLGRANVRLCFSHTHSGPVVGRHLFPLAPEDAEHLRKASAYAAFLRRRIVEGVEQAVRDEGVVLAQARYAVVPNAMAVNRREVKEAGFDGTRRGETEGRLSVLWFEAVGNASRVVAGVYALAAHASVITAGYRYSGDYPGVASGKVEGRDGLGGVWLFAAGAGGDQNVYPRGDAVDAGRHGSALADQIVDAVGTGRGRALEADVGRGSGSIAATHEFVALPFRTVLSRRTLRAMSRRRSEEPTSKRMAARWLSVPDAREDADGSTGTPALFPNFPIAVWRIGRLRIAFLGGEPTVGYSAAIRSQSNIDWVVGYTDDVMGYVGTAGVLRDGSKEGSDRVAIYYGLPSAWDETVEALIMSTCARLASALQ